MLHCTPPGRRGGGWMPTIALTRKVSTREAMARMGRMFDAAKAALRIPPEALVGGGFTFPRFGSDPEPWVCTLTRYDAKANVFHWSRPARWGPPITGTIELYHVYEALHGGRMHRNPPVPGEEAETKTKKRRKRRGKGTSEPDRAAEVQEDDVQGDAAEDGSADPGCDEGDPDKG